MFSICTSSYLKANLFPKQLESKTAGCCLHLKPVLRGECTLAASVLSVHRALSITIGVRILCNVVTVIKPCNGEEEREEETTFFKDSRS